MTDAERIESLERKILELEDKLDNKRLVNHWQEIGNGLKDRLLTAFKAERMNPRIAATHSAITCLVGKSFCKNNVNSLSRVEAEEAKPFVDYIITFITETRDKYEFKDMVSGYERKLE